MRPILLICSLLAGESISGKVVKVTDGDTVTVLVDRQQVKVRLAGIDCPESRQPFGTRAKQFLSDHIFGHTVRVESQGKDRYGRVIGEVFVDGRSVNESLVEAGFAWHYKQYSDDETLSRLEIQAREEKRGLWSDKNPVAPWEWRKTERERRKR